MKSLWKKCCNVRVGIVWGCLLTSFCAQADVVSGPGLFYRPRVGAAMLWYTVAVLVSLFIFCSIIGYWRVCKNERTSFIRLLQVDLLGGELILWFASVKFEKIAFGGSGWLLACLVMQFLMSFITGGWLNRTNSIELPKTKMEQWVRHDPSRSKVILLILLLMGILSCVALCFKSQALYERERKRSKIIKSYPLRRYHNYRSPHQPNAEEFHDSRIDW